MANKADLGSDGAGGVCIAFGFVGMVFGVLDGKSNLVIAGGFLLVVGALLRIDAAIRRQKAD
ncbi:hypothetical protein AB0B66_20775 [Catellatospora sp. NPDC049111]|uniref:hypothetical protein n=1 Tax=Catellatospora sp. NPDC049111 TaxID=3155271 RepID=UPI0033F0E58D